MTARPATTTAAEGAVGTKPQRGGVNQEKGQNQMTRENTVNVPIAPTEAMLDAATMSGMVLAGSDLSDHEMTSAIWSAMLRAAPLHEGEGEPVAWRYRSKSGTSDWMVTQDPNMGEWPNLIVEPLYAAPPPSVEVERLREALERLTVMRDQARDGTPVTDPNEWEADELTAIIGLLALSRKQEPGVPTPGDWIEWSGGPNPVPGRNAEVKLRSGDCFTGSDLSPDATWQHIWGEADSIAYRIVPTPGGRGVMVHSVAQEGSAVPTCDVPKTVADLLALLDPKPRTKTYSAGTYLSLAPSVECADGFKMSVQASENHYCKPRDNGGRWYLVEVGYPSEKVAAFMPYIDGEDSAPTDTVYGCVPIEIVAQAIIDHGGFKARTAVETRSAGTQPGLPGEVKQSPANQEQGQSE
jgi:hypothetical protein